MKPNDSMPALKGLFFPVQKGLPPMVDGGRNHP